MNQLVGWVCSALLLAFVVGFFWHVIRERRESSRCPKCHKNGLRGVGNLRAFLYQAGPGGHATYKYVCKHCGHEETRELNP